MSTHLVQHSRLFARAPGAFFYHAGAFTSFGGLWRQSERKILLSSHHLTKMFSIRHDPVHNGRLLEVAAHGQPRLLIPRRSLLKRHHRRISTLNSRQTHRRISTLNSRQNNRDRWRWTMSKKISFLSRSSRENDSQRRAYPLLCYAYARHLITHARAWRQRLYDRVRVHLDSQRVNIQHVYLDGPDTYIAQIPVYNQYIVYI